MRWLGAKTGLMLGVLVASSAVACGPGRQAAWQRGAAAGAAGDGTLITADWDTLAAQAERAWASRGDRAALTTCITAWEQMRQLRPDDAQTLTNLARAYFFLADGFLRLEGATTAELRAMFEKGVLAGEQAMMASSSAFARRVRAGEKVAVAVREIGVEGQAAMYWYAANLGKFSVAKGFSTTLFYKDRIYAVMQAVLALDETFYHGAPHRYFGAFYARAPAFAGGDMGKAKHHFERAMALGGDYFGTKVLYAEYYAKKLEDRDLFTRLLGQVRDGDPHRLPELVPEQLVEQKKAQRLLAIVDEIF